MENFGFKHSSNFMSFKNIYRSWPDVIITHFYKHFSVLHEFKIKFIILTFSLLHPIYLMWIWRCHHCDGAKINGSHISGWNNNFLSSPSRTPWQQLAYPPGYAYHRLRTAAIAYLSRIWGTIFLLCRSLSNIMASRAIWNLSIVIYILQNVNLL